jgi:hypothetical protein
VLTDRHLLAHGELVATSGLDAVHVIRAVGPRAGIDQQLRGPEQGGAGRRLRMLEKVDLATLPVGAHPRRRRGRRPARHGGEGPGAGLTPLAAR